MIKSDELHVVYHLHMLVMKVQLENEDERTGGAGKILSSNGIACCIIA